ncbi:probable serine/threonine-protein kinase PBL28 [Lactuca sativa]|uniref:Protein kinase domain-containing protein n=1 Tax=Lactuca sativa TaxID=4236 RepID=A0A9R1VP31_LACSA|nr:probable serine/threonine-protein kinase PBL28 [Lactuca sativa]KAJ0208287.1 hypothetical protein LSAT_V11C500243960 [Lactuca sativa]
MAFLKQFEHLRIPLADLIAATNSFSKENWIGGGGFGQVYQGILASKGNTTVAIKVLDRSFGQGDGEFWKEVMMLSEYKHENIISLLGFCDEKSQKILVYKYASRKSLDEHIENKELTWARRLKICIDAARGLAYLHNPAGTQQRLLHRDIKSSNILLDENWNAIIADFGLSKFGPANQKNTFLFTNNTVGTVGYVDPQYMEDGVLTKESDVYSFGVVLFEVLCGRLCIVNQDGRQSSLTRLVRVHIKGNKLHEIVWCNIKDDIHPESLKVFAKIAYQCLKRNHEGRPRMEVIVQELEKSLKFQEAFDQAKEENSKQKNTLVDFKEICPPGGSNLVILYTTSVKGIRKTSKDCLRVHSLLKSLKFLYQERDIAMHSDFRDELLQMLGKSAAVPSLFIKGRYIGGAEEVFRLHEQGKFRSLLAEIPLNKSEGPCKRCAGVRSVVCRKCNGSHLMKLADGKRTTCTECNKNGLIKCPNCF